MRLTAAVVIKPAVVRVNEVREKLILVQPRTLGQAGRIEGMTPGALTALLAHVKKATSLAAEVETIVA